MISRYRITSNITKITDYPLRVLVTSFFVDKSQICMIKLFLESCKNRTVNTMLM